MATTDLQRRLFLFGLFVLFYMTFSLEAARQWNTDSEQNYDDLNTSPRRQRANRGAGRNKAAFTDRRNVKQRSEKPNIILILTDDQDELLGK